MPVYATKSVSVSAASATALSTATGWIPTDIHSTPFNLGFGVVKTGTGDITFRVEHTFDDVFDDSVTPTTFIHEDVSAASASIDGNYAYGVRAVRLATVSASGTSTVAITVVQAGI